MVIWHSWYAFQQKALCRTARYIYTFETKQGVSGVYN